MVRAQSSQTGSGSVYCYSDRIRIRIRFFRPDPDPYTVVQTGSGSVYGCSDLSRSTYKCSDLSGSVVGCSDCIRSRVFSLDLDPYTVDQTGSGCVYGCSDWSRRIDRSSLTMRSTSQPPAPIPRVIVRLTVNTTARSSFLLHHSNQNLFSLPQTSSKRGLFPFHPHSSRAGPSWSSWRTFAALPSALQCRPAFTLYVAAAFQPT